MNHFTTQPLLIKEANENFEDKAPNEDEDQHNEGLVQADEVTEDEIANEDAPHDEDATF